MPASIQECREKILSNDYFDVIIDFPLNTAGLEGLDLCYVNVDNLFNIIYVNRNTGFQPTDYLYSHRSLPKLYGLMQESQTEGVGNTDSGTGNVGNIARTAAGTAMPTVGSREPFDPNSLIVSGITQVQREPLKLDAAVASL